MINSFLSSKLPHYKTNHIIESYPSPLIALNDTEKEEREPDAGTLLGNHGGAAPAGHLT